ncbi:hypothetical protein [Nocardia xishanensis]|uniref:hypothetical protein n=1 Tax=Nocardia xishanensis TaxID=238964 RepID=UPI000837839D|nr:hypothetical protein [Nocardia xishanensis]
MKRISVIVLAVGAVALAATGCGGSDESSDASGLRKGTPGTSASATHAPTTTKASAPPTSGSAATTTQADTSGLGPASRTTCGEFKGLDSDAEKRVIEEILAENPDSEFAGSPNVALGTAKLVCLSPGNVDKPVAVAARIIAPA